MLTVLFILSLISIFTSFIPIWGLVLNIILLILTIYSTVKAWQIDYKKKFAISVLTIIITTTIISGIYTSIKVFFAEALDISASLKTVKTAKLIQEQSSLQNVIKFYIATQSAKKQATNLTTKDKLTIYKSSEDIKYYPSNLKDIIAINDGNIKYYKINFDKLDTKYYISNKNIWVIDINGKVYLNIDDISNY